MIGRLIGIARREGRRKPMETMTSGVISLEAGLASDSRGAKFVTRQITVLGREDWEAALMDLADLMGPPDLPWTTRRANLLVEGVRMPRAKGGVLRIGAVELEITGQTNPCHRMEEAYQGLLRSLHPEWRGGVTCRVRTAGVVKLGDAVEVMVSPKEHNMRLPG